MIVAVLSDIHGNDAALNAVIRDFPEGVDRILFVGDLTGYYAFTSECCALLRPFDVTGVRGNHDQVLLDAWSKGTAPGEDYVSQYGLALTRTYDKADPDVRNAVEALPMTQRVTLDGMKISLVHGSPADPLNGRIYPDCKDWEKAGIPSDADVVCLGHTHYAYYRVFGGCTVLNPGAVGQARDGKGAAYALLNTGTGEVSFRRVAYDAESVKRDARAQSPNMPYLWEVLDR